MTQYTIRYGEWAGTRLEIGRVPRQHIDRFIAANPEPEPPLKNAIDLGVEVWGDPNEQIPDHADANYLAEQATWNQRFSSEMIGVLVGAIKIPRQTEAAAMLEIDEMRALKLMEGDGALPSLLLLSDQRDLEAVINLIFYNSTVTLQGLAEAAMAYNVRWRGKKVPVAGRARGKAQASGIFEARNAAQWSHYRWPDFCELSGQEQSAIVALYRYQSKLEELAYKGV